VEARESQRRLPRLLRRHFYSGPSALLHEEIWVRATTTTVELLDGAERVAAHARSYVKGGFTTDRQHMPSAHRKHAEWTPSRIVGWARTVGPMTEKLAETILAERRHPEWGYRSCLGLFRLAKRYGDARVEAACLRALAHGARSYRHVASILQHGLDRVAPTDDAPRAESPIVHENVRGTIERDTNVE
jgi:transposase